MGDCLEILPQIPEKTVDLVIADLPYGTTRAQWDAPIDLKILWKQYHRVGKANCVYLLFGSQPFTSHLIMSNQKNFRYCWYWKKERGTGFLNAKKQPLRIIEEICVFYCSTPVAYNPERKKLDKPYNHKLPVYGTELVNPVETFGKHDAPVYRTFEYSYPNNLLFFPREIKKSIHPTQKPLALVEYLIRTYSNPGDVILDNVMGSGTSGVACKKLKRSFIGIEIDQIMFEKAKKRIELS